MSDFRIHTQRSWEPAPEPKNKAHSTSFFTLPTNIDLKNSHKVESREIFQQLLTKNVPLDAKQYPTDELIAFLIQDIGDGTMKKGKSAVVAEEGIDPAIQQFAETLVESLRETHDSKLEPFEIYAQKVRNHIFENVASFKERFDQGYQVLLKEVSKNESTKS